MWAEGDANLFSPHQQQKPNKALGGVAGGEKMMIHGLLFKLCGNPDKIYGEDDYFCRKPAGLEILSAATLLKFRNYLLFTPLICAIDFKGVRISCQTVGKNGCCCCLCQSSLNPPPLPTYSVPIDNDTLVMGSVDAGLNVYNKEVEARSVMVAVGNVLGLREHLAGSNTVDRIVGPADVEIHRGKDSRLYAIDLHRLFPPSSEEPSKFLYQLFRPEFMMKWAEKEPQKMLSSDVFSRFSTPTDPAYKEHGENARAALRHLKVSWRCLSSLMV